MGWNIGITQANGWDIGITQEEASGGVTGTGALAAQAATVAGSGTVTFVNDGSGALDAQAATIAGVGLFTDQVLEEAGAGINFEDDFPMLEEDGVASGVSGVGNLSSSASTLSGAGKLIHTGSGALAAQSASMSGLGNFLRTGTGALAAQDATINGVGAVNPGITGTGDLDAQAATIAGAGKLTHPGSGALAAQAATINGVGTVATPSVISGEGALQAQSATIDNDLGEPEGGFGYALRIFAQVPHFEDDSLMRDGESSAQYYGPSWYFEPQQFAGISCMHSAEDIMRDLEDDL